MIRTAILTLILLVLLSCDFYETSVFHIKNNTSDTITIKTKIGRDDGIRFLDSIHLIYPNEEIIFFQDLGQTNPDFSPPDYYEQEDSIPPFDRFDIFKNDQRIDSLRLRKYWTFTSSEQTGNYFLTIAE